MAATGDRASKVVPAQLSFLAIYNPALGQSDETFHDQVVFYHSKDTKSRRKHDEQEERDGENEKLRQIGLAQGMVDFARSFSDDEPINHVETEKSRIVMHELERGWWVLASIDLTRLPAASSPKPSSSTEASVAKPAIEYSSREVSPPDLLVQQLLRAHNIFRLHHGPSLYDLYVRLPRHKFCNILDRFWTRFANTWDVLLHGSPAVEMYGGIKLAAGGELGMGVGEEEWGSGEREVFEDFAGRTEGLVDMVVSRFGEPAEPQDQKSIMSGKSKAGFPHADPEPWMGSGRYTEAADGVIFSGVGTIARSSLRDVSNWMQWIYAYGDHAYGVKENPSSDRRRRPRRKRLSAALNGRARSPIRAPSREESMTPKAEVPPARPVVQSTQSQALPPGIPRPIVSAAEASLNQASSDAQAHQANDREQHSSALADPDTWMRVLTLGYGSSWGGKRPQAPQRSSTQNTAQRRQSDDPEKSSEASLQQLDPQPVADRVEEALKAQVARENHGHFIIGLQGDLDHDGQADSDTAVGDTDGAGDFDLNHRILLRTLHIKVKQKSQRPKSTAVSRSTQDTISADAPQSYIYEKVRVVMFVHRPFVTTLLFDLHTPTLSYPSFYQSLRSYLLPLYRPLTLSTSPARVAARIAASSPTTTFTTSSPSLSPSTTTTTDPNPIFNLVFDPLALTVHSSIPSIPEPGTMGAEGLAYTSAGAAARWTRVEALNVHSQILATVASTRRSPNDIERTCRTARGWWLVWMRLLPSGDFGEGEQSASVGGDDGSGEEGGERERGHGAAAGAEPSTPIAEKTLSPKASIASLVPLASPTSETSTSSFSAAAAIAKTTANEAAVENIADEDADHDDGEDTNTATITSMTPRPSARSQTQTQSLPTASLREALLIRRARDVPPAGGHRRGKSGSVSGGGGGSGIWRMGMGMGFGGASGSAAGGEDGRGRGGGEGGQGLAEGVGVDARRYVEGLLSLSR